MPLMITTALCPWHVRHLNLQCSVQAIYICFTLMALAFAHYILVVLGSHTQLQWFQEQQFFQVNAICR